MLSFVIIVIFVVLVVGSASYAFWILMNPTRTAGDRLRELVDVEEEDAYDIGGAEMEGIDALAGRIGSIAQPQSEEERSKMRQTLLQAGYKHRHALEILNGVKVTLALSLPMLVMPLAAQSSLYTGIGMVFMGAVMGYYLPGIYVQNLVDKRQKDLLRSFPDSLDLLVSSVEAGLGIDAAFRRVASEMEAAAPDLSREFQLVNHEISAGVPRVDALTHLYERTGLDEVRSLVNMLSQAERFGTSVAKSLRVHATATRAKRMAKAEEEAAKVSPKLTVVMIIFLLPVLMSILMGPAIINVKNTFAGM